MANQTWITYFEPTSSTTSTIQTKTLTTSLQERLSLTKFLLTTGLHPLSKAHVDFLINSHSLKAPVLLLNDKALTTIYQQHCKNDPVITITIRPSNDPTPSSSHDRGAIYAFLERIKVNGHMWNASGAVEPER